MTAPSLGRTHEAGTRVDVFGVRLMVTDYADATARIIESARERRAYAVSALAVHGLMEAARDADFRERLNTLDMVAPDGQPVRWAMNALHRCGLRDRVSGPHLTWHVIEAAVAEGIGLFLFGSSETTCTAFATEIRRRFPHASVQHQSDRFRDATPEEDAADIERINASGAGVVLVGRGCPRQERWVAAHRDSVRAATLAVGAAFDYGAGNFSEPPRWVQRAGLHWLHRLLQEPSRLWKRYLVTNTLFLWCFARAFVRRSDRRR